MTVLNSPQYFNLCIPYSCNVIFAPCANDGLHIWCIYRNKAFLNWIELMLRFWWLCDLNVIFWSLFGYSTASEIILKNWVIQRWVQNKQYKRKQSPVCRILWPYQMSSKSMLMVYLPTFVKAVSLAVAQLHEYRMPATWFWEIRANSTSVKLQWNLSATTTSIMKFITCDAFSNVF